ncbi:MAG: DUF559 domain-containing protein [Mesorhizobium sp.]
MTNSTPFPSRAEALDTSPPRRGGEDMPALSSTPILSPHETGERCHGEAVTETGKPPKSRSRRKPKTTERGHSLRWTESEAEGLLWLELKGGKLGGYHFTHQLPIGPYFADFACRSRMFVVEVDGSQHVDDRRRYEFMLLAAIRRHQRGGPSICLQPTGWPAANRRTEANL